MCLENDGVSCFLRFEVTRNICNQFLYQQSDSETPVFVSPIWTHNKLFDFVNSQAFITLVGLKSTCR